MSTVKTTDERTRSIHANMLIYFHTEKGDMRRYCDFENAIEEFPEIKRALQDAEYYSGILDALVAKMIAEENHE